MIRWQQQHTHRFHIHTRRHWYSFIYIEMRIEKGYLKETTRSHIQLIYLSAHFYD